jgi:hypothetical protein
VELLQDAVHMVISPEASAFIIFDVQDLRRQVYFQKFPLYIYHVSAITIFPFVQDIYASVSNKRSP